MANTKISICSADVSTIEEALMVFNAAGQFSFLDEVNRSNTTIDISVNINYGRPLLRWGSDLKFTIRDGEIIYNNLVERAWNEDPEKARAEADRAIVYFARRVLDTPQLCDVLIVIDFKDIGQDDHFCVDNMQHQIHKEGNN